MQFSCESTRANVIHIIDLKLTLILRILPFKILLIRDVNDPIKNIEKSEGGWKHYSGNSIDQRYAIYVSRQVFAIFSFVNGYLLLSSFSIKIMS